MNGFERRATVRLLRYWQSLRQQDGVPWFSDFRPERNPVPWDHCLLVTLPASQPRFFVEHVGAAFGCEVLPVLAEKVLQTADELQRRPVPHEVEGRLGLEDARIVLYRSIWLPFRNAAHEVRYGLAAVTWKADRRVVRPAPRPALAVVDSAAAHGRHLGA